MTDTTNLALPLIAGSQAQKHVTHNDAILRLDAIVELGVIDRGLTEPPGAPSDGDRYIPGSGATGDWDGWDLNIAWYTDGLWTKLVPREGWRVWVADEDLLLVFDGSEWQPWGSKLATYAVSGLPAPTAGAMIYVTDETGGAVPAFGDGSDWRRVTDRAVVS